MPPNFGEVGVPKVIFFEFCKTSKQHFDPYIYRRGPCQDAIFWVFFVAKPLKNKGFVGTTLKKRLFSNGFVRCIFVDFCFRTLFTEKMLETRVLDRINFF